MGCTSSKKKHDSKVNEPITQADLDLIKISWDAIENKENFETEEEMLNNSQLRYHAKKVIEALDKVLVAVVSNSTQGLDQDLLRLGRNHFHHGVKSDYFGGFEESLLYCLKSHLPPRLFGTKTRIAWKKAVKMIFNYIGEGIEKEEKETCEHDKLKLEIKEKLKQSKK